MTDIVEQLRDWPRMTPVACKEAADEIKQLRAEIEGLKAENARLIEERARFPDRPDDIGRMIEAHIGNLKLGKSEADRHACNAFDNLHALATEIERLRADLYSMQYNHPPREDMGR